MDSKDLLLEALGRIPGEIGTAVDGLTPEQLRWAPADGANSIGWLVWHLTRVQDHHLSELTGDDQVYVSGDWGPRFGLETDAHDTGYAHKPAQVAAVAPDGGSALTEYYDAVHKKSVSYVSGLTADDLDRVVDKRWDPPVTLGVRLISVIDDDAQHAGQAAYVRGLLR